MKKKAKFKIGDVVKCLDVNPNYIGKEGMVIYAPKAGENLYTVRYQDKVVQLEYAENMKHSKPDKPKPKRVWSVGNEYPDGDWQIDFNQEYRFAAASLSSAKGIVKLLNRLERKIARLEAR